LLEEAHREADVDSGLESCLFSVRIRFRVAPFIVGQVVLQVDDVEWIAVGERKSRRQERRGSVASTMLQ
jgi:hypothetical protein